MLGVVSVVALYALNRVAFSPGAGLMGAALMAVSPFHVYLSQEARHYTAPMFCITLALLGLIQIIKNLSRQKIYSWVWVSWLLINIIGLYTHYFFLMAVVAQLATLSLWMLRHHSNLQSRHWIIAGIAAVTLLMSYFPWLSTILEHMGRPETSWLMLSRTNWLNYIPPIYQTLAGWIIMVVSLPVERQPAWIAIPMGLLMLVFFGWLMKEAYHGLRHLRNDSRTRISTQILLCFIGFVLFQFWVVIYILGKDLSLAPRYNFVYYPAICSLLGAVLAHSYPQKRWSSNSQITRPNIQLKPAMPLFAGIISCIFVIFNLVLITPYNPNHLADKIVASSTPNVFLMPYQGDTEIALGLSLIWEISQRDTLASTPIYWHFLPASVDESKDPNRASLFLSDVALPTTEPVEIWLLGFRWLPEHFPLQFQVFNQDQETMLCQAKPDTFSSATLPHQRYSCTAAS